MIKIQSILLLLILGIVSNAQDTIKLKDGSVLNGTLLTSFSNEIVDSKSEANTPQNIYYSEYIGDKPNKVKSSEVLSIVDSLGNSIKVSRVDTSLYNINMITGEVYQGRIVSPIYNTIIDENDTMTYFLNNLYYEKKGKGKLKSVKIEEIFSISNDAKEILVYRIDSMYNYEISEEQARMVMLGSQDALNGFKSPLLIGGAAPVGGTVLLLNFWSIPVIPAYVLFTDWFTPKITVKKGANEKYITNDYYRAGFETAARKKRIRRTFLVGFSGFVLGVLVHEPVAKMFEKD